MAKRKLSRRKNPVRRAIARKKPAPKRPATKKPVRRKPAPKKPVATRKAASKKRVPTRKATTTPSRKRAPAWTHVARSTVAKAPRLDRARRTLDEGTLRTPPSSLDMVRHGTAARSGRAEIAERRIEQGGMSASITGGDVDVNVEDAYFTGDEAPGGDNPSPDLEVVDDIGKALGVQYEDSEELRGSDKVTERDKHRWEWDPASSEDYKDRK
jgi:Family of unknown function (DUF6335)